MEKNEKAFATMDKPCSSKSPPKSGKRCATEPLKCLENTSTPYRSGKKRIKLQCDKTPLVSPILNSTSRVTTLLPSGQIASTSRVINITRGIQTIAPETVNRYCQVSVARIRKPTASVNVQTEECPFRPSLPPATPVSLTEAGCQTDEPLLPKTSIGSTQTEPSTLSSPPVERAVVCCQTDVIEESRMAQNGMNEQQDQNQAQEEAQQSEHESEDHGSLAESITTILNDIAKQYGIELTPEKKKKKKSNTKKKEIEQLQECLANKTYKAIASRVNKKMSNILEKHMTEYGRETVASRQQLIRWTKQFIRRQQQLRDAASKPLRKIILIRKIVRTLKRPSVREKAVQCAQEQAGISVSTQWQRQKVMVTKKTPSREACKKATPKPTSTDTKTCSAGSGTRSSLRQTKLSSYAKDQDGEQKIQGKQQRQRKQQGEHSPKSSKSVAVTATPSTCSKTTKAKPSPQPVSVSVAVTATPTTSSKTTKAKPSPQPVVNKKKKQNGKKMPSIEIHIEETPSPPHSEPEELERKYLPYRSPPHYPTQCSKSTETSFLTPSKIRSIGSELRDTDRQSYNHRTATEHTRAYNSSILLSPLERMYVESTAMESRKRPEYNTFLVPLGSNESIPPTPSSRMMYTNPPERRVLLRSGSSTGGLVREKPPEVSIISSQQLYSQIGLAVEKALKNKSLPTLATMYGEPFVEVFNGCEEHAGRSKASGDGVGEQRSDGKVTKQQYPTAADKFVCSSGKEEVNVLQGSQPVFKRPPFHTERSPSLSPIIYQDENSDDEMIL